MSTHKRHSDKTKYMYFMIEDEKMFDKYMAIWEKVSNIIKTNFNSEFNSAYNTFIQKLKKDSTQKKAFNV